MILSRRELISGWGGWELILNPDWMESIEAIPECPLREGYLMATLEWSLSSEFDDRVPTMAALLFRRSEEHTSELQSLMRISYAVFCLKINSLNGLFDTEQSSAFANTPWPDSPSTRSPTSRSCFVDRQSP